MSGRGWALLAVAHEEQDAHHRHDDGQEPPELGVAAVLRRGGGFLLVVAAAAGILAPRLLAGNARPAAAGIRAGARVARSAAAAGVAVVAAPARERERGERQEREHAHDHERVAAPAHEQQRCGRCKHRDARSARGVRMSAGRAARIALLIRPRLLALLVAVAVAVVGRLLAAARERAEGQVQAGGDHHGLATRRDVEDARGRDQQATAREQRKKGNARDAVELKE